METGSKYQDKKLRVESSCLRRAGNVGSLGGAGNSSGSAMSRIMRLFLGESGKSAMIDSQCLEDIFIKWK